MWALALCSGHPWGVPTTQAWPALASTSTSLFSSKATALVGDQRDQGEGKAPQRGSLAGTHHRVPSLSFPVKNHHDGAISRDFTEDRIWLNGQEGGRMWGSLASGLPEGVSRVLGDAGVRTACPYPCAASLRWAGVST